MQSNKTNTGKKDPEGRTVWAGPRGGLFIERDGKRRAVMSLSTRPRTSPSPRTRVTALPLAVLTKIFDRMGTANVTRASMVGRNFRNASAPILEQRTKAAKTVKKSWKRPTDIVALAAQTAVLRHAAQAENQTGRRSPAVEAKLRSLGWTKPFGDWKSPEVPVGRALVATARTETVDDEDDEDHIVDIEVLIETAKVFPMRNGRFERVVMVSASSDDGSLRSPRLSTLAQLRDWVKPSAHRELAIVHAQAQRWYPKVKAAIRGML